VAIEALVREALIARLNRWRVTVNAMVRTASLHWCRAEDLPRILAGERVSFIDGGSFHQGKDVQLFAQAVGATTYNPQPPGFEIRRESFFLWKLGRKIVGRWHPFAPLEADEPLPGKWFAKHGWTTGTDNVTRQGHYFFRDKVRNESGSITVSQVDWAVSRPEVGVTGGVKVVGPGLVEITPQLGVNWKGTQKHWLGASSDPDIRVVLMYPGGVGEADLGAHVGLLLGAQFGGALKQTEFTHGQISDLTDGYVGDRSSWIPTFEDGAPETIVTVRPEQAVELRIPLDDLIEARETIRTAYALRAMDASDPTNYAVSDVVEIERVEGKLRITA
jgi:hypothetical protein